MKWVHTLFLCSVLFSLGVVFLIAGCVTLHERTGPVTFPIIADLIIGWALIFLGVAFTVATSRWGALGENKQEKRGEPQ
jgi:hypothetical protein